MTEHEIIQGCKKQRTNCQKQLVLRYSSMLLGVSMRYAGDREGAKDILQEAFIMIFRYLPNYQETGSFVAWMKRIVVTTALQNLRKTIHQKEFSGLEHVSEEFASPEIYSRLATEELMDLIRELPDGFRTVFNLNAIEGYSHKEIGELLGISEGTSRSQLARARKWLQQRITSQKKIRI